MKQIIVRASENEPQGEGLVMGDTMDDKTRSEAPDRFDAVLIRWRP